MKKIFLLAIIFALCATNLTAQNMNTTTTAPTGAVLVPGMPQLYTTPADEMSKMMRSAAVSACVTHGDGWRLPTLGELQIMYSHRFEMDFTVGTYWTSDKVRGEFAFYALDFKKGKTLESKYDKEFFVRCVWTPQSGAPVAANPTPAETAAPAPTPEETAAPAPADNAVVPAPMEEKKVEVPAQTTETPAPTLVNSHDEKTNFFPPYRHGIGVVAGNLNGFSYKVFPADKFAVSIDLGMKITLGGINMNYNYLTTYGNFARVWDWTYDAPQDVEVNVNFLYQGHFTKGLYGIIGGGPSLGYSWNISPGYQPYAASNYYYNYWGYDNVKIGMAALLGLEYKFNIPLAMQVDFRPGYAMLMSTGFFAYYFDWGLNLSLRYAFGD